MRRSNRRRTSEPIRRVPDNAQGADEAETNIEGTPPRQNNIIVRAQNSNDDEGSENLADGDGFTMQVSRRQKRRAVRGNREGNRLRLAPAATVCHLWVYNLHADCSAEELKAYVAEIIEDDEIKVEKPVLKRTDSSAFVVTCNRRHYDTLMSPNSWEENIRVRAYRMPRPSNASA